MRQQSCCALLVLAAVGCNFDDEGVHIDHGLDASTDSGPADSGVDSGKPASPIAGSNGQSGRGGTGMSTSGTGGMAPSGGRGGNPNGGSGALGTPIGGVGPSGAGDGGGASGSSVAGSSGGGNSNSGGRGGAGSGGNSAGNGGAANPAGGGADDDGGMPSVPLLDLVSFEGVASQLATGQTIRARATWRNSSAATIVITQAVITGRAPGATHENGPYDDFSPVTNGGRVAPGGTLSVSANLLPRPVLGVWEAYPTYSDEDGVYHDYRGVNFTIVADQEYGTFQNAVWPVADPADPPAADRRFAYACYKKAATGDSAVCEARYGLGTLPYQVNPNDLSMLGQQCMMDGGVLLQHACPTNQMLQLCWENTRSPAYFYRCEYYGDPNNKSPQFPGAAPDIVFYNEDYAGRDPQP